ncbi:GA module [Gardnerella vaginalis]|uniref:GA module n=1 Tax=Gardnerella vaginalis TaxID=2702 RepID=UPI0039F0646B
MTKKIMSAKHLADLQKSMQKSNNSVIYAPLSKSVCAAMLAGAMVLGGGVLVSTPAPAYADGYVDGTGNNIYYGYKTDASYTEARFHIEVDYYDTLKHAKAGEDEGKDPLGKFVRVHYLSNCNKDGGTADDWRFRPMWWFGVPKGLQNVQDITYTRVEKLTQNGQKQPFTPAGSSQFKFTDTKGYSQVSQKKYNKPEEWNNISNFYFKDSNVLASKGWKQLLGLNGGKYDNAGNTADQWDSYKAETDGLQGIFVDWESAGERFYDMTYVGEMTKEAWENRDVNPLRFAAGVYRFAGNWHYAVGQKHNTPKIADHFNLTYPPVTKVKDTKKLTGDEQEAVKNAIVDANKNAKYYSDLVDKVEVSEKGDATITFKDKTTRTMPASLLVTKDESDKDKYKPTLPERTPVVNLAKLTPDEKTKIRQAIIDANGKGNPNDFLNHIKKDSTGGYDFKVADNGDVSVEYQDGSKITIPASELVFQGPKISDWAPYVVPDTIEVKDPAKLDAGEQKKVTDAFDAANADLDVYTKAKKDGKTPVTFDKDFKNAIITWADGSTTEIPSWQFLTKKPAAPTPGPVDPTPTPAEKKTFTVDFSNTKSRVVPNFDPFNASSASDTAKDAVRAFKGMLNKLTAKDSDGETVTITDVDFDFANGEIIFKAGNDYKDQRYPMSLLFKKGSTGAQNPTQQKNEDTKDGYTYKIPHVNIAGDSPTLAERQEALKQFITLNYNGTVPAIKDDGSSNTITIEGSGLTAKDPSMTPYGSGDGHIVDVMVSHLGDITINYDITPVEDDDDTDHSMTQQLFIDSEDIYIKKNNNKDNTIEKLKELAKQIRDKRKTAGDLTDDVIKNTLKATDKDIDGMTDENTLRDLIKKIADYQKPKPVEYKYNFEKLTLDHDGEPNDDDYKKIVVDQFLKKNYTTNDWSKLENAYSKSATVLSVNNANTYGLTPATSGTSGLNIYTGDRQAGGVTSVVVDSKTGDLVVRGWKAGTTSANAEELIRIKKADLFTPKSKEQNPTPSAEDLKKLKEQAKNVIERNPKLTEEQKKDYKNQIDKADTKEKIQNILKEANKKGNENNVNANDLKEKEKKEKEKREEEKRKEEEEKRKEEEKKQLQKDKDKAKEALKNLTNLTDGDSGDKKKLSDEIDNAQTPDEVKNILEKAKAINDARGALKDGELPFLSHGKGESDNDDKALKELIGADSAKKDSTLTALETALAKKDPAATAKEIKTALDAAKRQNAINEQNAKNAGIAKLEAKKADLDAAYKALTEEQKKSAKEKYDAAITAITNAESAVNKATKPSEIKNAVESVKDETINAANKAIEDAKGKRDTSQNTYDDQSELDKEKEAQKKHIQDSDLPDADKQKAIDDINNAKKIGDPTAIANRALKVKKIEDAKKQIAALDHLNNAQKKAYEDIINSTDAHNIKDDDGNETGKDDIDNALADAIATDHAMERLEKLKEIADKFANGEKYKGLKDDNDQKKAFDAAATAAGAVLDKDKGDAKTADQVNELYKDLLKAMQAIDDKAKGAGVITDALQAEVDNDKAFKPNATANPATKGDSVYTTASADKKAAFDKALSDAEDALNKANGDNADQAKPDSTPRTPEQEAKAQQAVDNALQTLENARKALDGVNTKPLQDEINKDSNVKDLDKYKYADKSKTDAFDKAFKNAQDLIDKLTGKTPAAQGEEDVTTKTQAEKQKLVDEALANLKAAEEALKGKKPVEPTPTPTPTPTPSPLPTPGAGTGAGTGNAGSGSEAGYGVNDNAPTTVDKGELNIQIDSAESDLQPGNAGNGNAGSNNAGNAANSGANAGNAASNNAGSNAANANAANGANSAAVNAAVESNQAVKQADAQVSKAQAALDAALAEAKKVAADPNATQAQVDAAARKLAAARKALAAAKAHAADVRASVRAQVLKSGSVAQLSKTGSDVSAFGLFAATISAAGAALFAAKRRGISRHSNK